MHAMVLAEDITVISRRHPHRRAHAMSRAPTAQHAFFQRQQAVPPAGADVAIHFADHSDERHEGEAIIGHARDQRADVVGFVCQLVGIFR